MAQVATVARYTLPSMLALEVWQSIIGKRCNRVPQAAEYRRFGVDQCQSGERAVSRVLFTDTRSMCGHSSRLPVAGRLERPTRALTRQNRERSGPLLCLCLAFLRVGFTLPETSPSPR